jgi:hypothetical protein
MTAAMASAKPAIPVMASRETEVSRTPLSTLCKTLAMSAISGRANQGDVMLDDLLQIEFCQGAGEEPGERVHDRSVAGKIDAPVTLLLTSAGQVSSG